MSVTSRGFSQTMKSNNPFGRKFSQNTQPQIINTNVLSQNTPTQGFRSSRNELIDQTRLNFLSNLT